MRVPGPRGFVLKTRRHDPRQPHQILLTRARIVHTGVAPVLGQILHRLGDREGVRIRDRFIGHVVAHTTHQRHAFRARRTSSHSRAHRPAVRTPVPLARTAIPRRPTTASPRPNRRSHRSAGTVKPLAAVASRPAENHTGVASRTRCSTRPNPHRQPAIRSAAADADARCRRSTSPTTHRAWRSSTPNPHASRNTTTTDLAGARPRRAPAQPRTLCANVPC